jgi:hypothetical protein
VAKARANLEWFEEKPLVHIWIAPADGSFGDASSSLRNDLLASINSSRHPNYPVRIDSFVPKFFSLTAGIVVDPAYLPALVTEAVAKALQVAFSFENREIGEGIAASSIVSVISEVKGVKAVRMDLLSVCNIPPLSIVPFVKLMDGKVRLQFREIKKIELIDIFPPLTDLLMPYSFPENCILRIETSELLTIYPNGIKIICIQP